MQLSPLYAAKKPLPSRPFTSPDPLSSPMVWEVRVFDTHQIQNEKLRLCSLVSIVPVAPLQTVQFSNYPPKLIGTTHKTAGCHFSTQIKAVEVSFANPYMKS